MKLTMRALMVLGLACAALGGQVGAQGTPPAAEAQADPAAAKKLDALIARYNKQQEDVSAAYSKATTDEEKQKALAGLPGKEYVSEFQAVADEARGTETAAQALLWVLRIVRDDKATAWGAIQTLLEEHMASPRLGELADNLRYGAYQHGEKPVLEALRAIVAESPHEKVRAGGLFALGAVLLESKEPSSKAEGRDCMEAVVAEYGEVASRGSTYKAAAEGFLYELDNLQIGMAAPEFESIDENGVKWKLSDYKGKVVVIDFWGFW